MLEINWKLLLAVFLLATGAASQDLTSTLHSTLYGVEVAYVDETVVFRCIVRGSNSMAWTSEEYIGTGGQRLEFSAAERPGSTHSAVGNSQTTTMLINATMDEIIVSELRISIQSNFPTPSVQCHNINFGTNSSITFLLAADTTSVICDKQTVCSGETVTCTCTTVNSNSLAWSTSDGNRVAFTSSDPLLTRRSVDGSSASAMLTENSDTNGIRVIMSNFTVAASSSRSNIILTCENVGRSTSESIIIPVSDFSIMTTIESCADPSGQATTPGPAGNENTLTSESCTVPITAAIVVPVIIFIIAALTVFILLMVYGRQHKKIKKLNKDKDELKETLKERNEKIEKLKTEKQDLEDDMNKKLQLKQEELKKTRRQLTETNTKLQLKEDELLNSKYEAARQIEILKADLKQKQAQYEAALKRK